MLKLKPELIKDLDTPAGLRRALQRAVELEHSTIPTYLYAYFSVRFAPKFSMDPPSTNYAINEALWQVVYEEMLHMGLACNILNAIGGKPNINRKGFVPSYPGPLPGGVAKGLIVPLAPFSRALLHDVFMEIEEPEKPIPGKANAKSILAKKPQHITIGQFYHAIASALTQQAPGIFVNRQIDLSKTFPDENTPAPPASPAKSAKSAQPAQPPTPAQPGLIPPAVTDLDTALAAISLIVDQGEGSSKSPVDPEGGLAHYYRYAEIYHGNKLVQDKANPDKWTYTGDPIPFDHSPDGVVPMIKNPREVDYPRDSQARADCHVFNQTYTLLLNYLHDAFNGKPRALDTAISLMDTLYANAQTLMANKLSDGAYAGPSFEYASLD